MSIVLATINQYNSSNQHIELILNIKTDIKTVPDHQQQSTHSLGCILKRPFDPLTDLQSEIDLHQRYTFLAS